MGGALRTYWVFLVLRLKEVRIKMTGSAQAGGYLNV